jgi:DNA end-binding protein Ku
MARSMWDGTLSFGLVNIGVSLRAAESKKNLEFTLLDERDHSPVGYQRVNKSTGKKVEWDQIVKGYEYEDGKYVVLTNEDFKKANIKATQTIEIVAFVNADEVKPMYFERPYFVVPQKRSEKSYALLRDALKHTHKVGIGKIVIRTREHLAAILPQGRGLVLEILRFSHELKKEDEIKISEKAEKPNTKELQLAEKLIEGMTESFKPEKYKDEYYEDLLHLIDKKIDAGETETSYSGDLDTDVGDIKPTQPKNIMDLLKKSLSSSPKAPKDHPKKTTKHKGRKKAA